MRGVAAVPSARLMRVVACLVATGDDVEVLARTRTVRVRAHVTMLDGTGTRDALYVLSWDEIDESHIPEAQVATLANEELWAEWRRLNPGLAPL